MAAKIGVFWWSISAPIFAPNFAPIFETISDVSTAEIQWRKIYRDFEIFFENIDLLIVPGNATPAFLIDDGIPREINGNKMENYMDASLIRSALTLTGHPVLALPCGRDHLGLPFGLQLVGKRRGDLELLKIAMALEATFSRNPALKRTIPNLAGFQNLSCSFISNVEFESLGFQAWLDWPWLA